MRSGGLPLYFQGYPEESGIDVNPSSSRLIEKLLTAFSFRRGSMNSLQVTNMIWRVCVVLISLVLLTASLCLAQQKTRILDESTPKNNFANPPIAIVSREVGNTPIIDSNILAGSDWLRDLTLTVKNISTKPIVRFQILLTIPKQGKMPYDAGMMVSFPQPERILDEGGKPTGDYKPLTVRVLQPGAVTKVQAWLHQLQILEDIKKQDVPDVDSVLVSIRQVVFDDGAGWLVGKETREDPDNPKGQIFVRPDTLFSLRSNLANFSNTEFGFSLPTSIL